MIPNSLPLGPELKGIFCRSQGERVTLIDGLTDRAAGAWKTKIRTGFAEFFVGRHPYIINVSGRGGRLIDVEFSMRLMSREGVVSIRVDDELQARRWKGRFSGNQSRVETFRLPEWHEAVRVAVYLEECLAYRGRVVLDDLPF